MYFRNLSLSYGVGTFEKNIKEELKNTKRKEREEKKQKKYNETQGGSQNGTQNETQNGTSMMPVIPSSSINDERPSSQGFMFLPPNVAKEAAQLHQNAGWN